MINEHGKPNDIWVDLVRPTLIDEQHGAVWKNIHAIIKNSDILITVNSAFSFIDHILQIGESYYSGGGFKYMFWFESISDRDAFLKELTTVVNKQIVYSLNISPRGS